MIEALKQAKNTNFVIGTGNILNINKKAGRKSTEELLESLQLTLQSKDVEVNESGEVHRSSDLLEKLKEHERSNISIAAKIFLNNSSVESLTEAVETLLKTLNVDHVDNAILAYHPKPVPESPTNGAVESSNSGENYGVLKWGSKNAETINELKSLWRKMEEYAESKKITQLGISDLDTDTLTELHAVSKVPPTIAQINLSSCCVVPPSLQEFCNKNDIQLLTHSDPESILADDTFCKMGLTGFQPTWTVRYQVHVRCRGVLSAKGYVVGVTKRAGDGDSTIPC